MFFKIIYNYIFGYVNIKLEGCFIERFINMASSKKIFLWNTKREKSTILYANISLDDFYKIKPIIKKTKTRLEIKSKRGLPFLFYRYKKRKIFFALLFIMFLLIFISSQFVWNIEITGNEKISKAEIMAELEKSGLKVGAKKTNVDVAEVINEVRLNRGDISWIGIDLKGTNAIVEVVEALEKPNVIDYEDYCNIISDKEGIITKINVQNGTPLVKPGDVVREGTMLVGGYLEGKYTGMRYVHSMAEIEAKVWYTAKKEETYKQKIKTKNGEKEEKYKIKLYNFNINLFKTLSNFKIYDTIEENKKYKIFSDFYLPIELIKITNYEIIEEEKIYTEEELEQKLKQELKQELDEKIEENGKLVNEQFNIKKEEGKMRVEVIYEVIENIGTEEKLIF